MAKFSGKNIEFKNGQKAVFGDNDDSSISWNEDNTELTITTVVSGVDPTDPGHLITRRYMEDYVTTVSGNMDHGELEGILDDDHPQYVPRDGSRGFTHTVSGIDPTEGYHLTTRQYTQDVLLGTASGVEQVGNVLFGSEFFYAIDETISSSNSTTYQYKLDVTVSGIPVGNYRLGVHFDWRISKNNIEFNYRIRQDNTITIEEISRPTYNDVNIYNPVTNFYYLEALTSGTHNFDIEYSSENTGSTVYIRNARLEFWRVS